MMNQNNATAAAIAAINEIVANALSAIQVIIGEFTTTTTETTTEATTTATTAPAETATTETTTEATTTATEIKNQISVTELDKIANDPTAIVVIDDDDKVIAVGSSLTSAETTTTTAAETTETATTTTEAAKTETTTTTAAETTETATTTTEAATETTTTTAAETTETATATAEESTTTETTTTEAVTETTVNGITTSRKAVVATTDDLVNIYEIIKYILQHEGVNSGIDKSVYAPTRNMYVTFNNGKYRMHLSMYDTEMMIALTKRCENDENIIMKIMINLSSIEVTSVDEEIEIAGNNARLNTAINTIASTIELIK